MMTTSNRISRFLRALLVWAVLTTSLAAAGLAQEQWVHISIEEDRDSSIEINLPLSAVEQAVKSVPRWHQHHHWLIFHDHHLHARDFHRMVEAARKLSANEERSLRIRSRSYVIARSNGDLLIERRGRFWQEDVSIRLAYPIAQALVSGASDEIDWPAGLSALAEIGDRQDIVVSDDDGETTMRLWVDSRSTS